MATYNISTSQGTEFVPEDISGSQSTSFVITNNGPGASYFVLETVPPYSLSTPKNTSGSFTLGNGLSGLQQNDYFAGVVVAPFTSSTLTFVPAVYITGSSLTIKGNTATPLNNFGNLTRAFISRTKYFSASIEDPEAVDNFLTSSLFSNASFLYIPSAYSASLVYAVTPYRGVGDLSFTRASSATRTLANGTVETPRTNHIRNSSMVGASTSPSTLPTNWIDISSGGLTRTVVGVGTENGLPYIDVRLTGTATGTIHSFTTENVNVIAATSGQSWVNSFYAKIISQSNPPNLYQFRTLYYSSSVYVNETNNTYTPTTTLARYSAVNTVPPGTINNIIQGIRFNLTISNTYDFTIRIAAPQMELGSQATDWIPTTNSARTTFAGITQDGTTGGNISRLDYSYGSDPALLLEPQRTNLALWSEQFDDAYWTKTRATITANSTTAPNGTTTADSLIQSAGQTLRGFVQTPFITTTGQVTYSVFAKKNTKNFAVLTDNAFGGFENSWFNLNTGTLGTIASGRTAKIENFDNGWYKCSITTPLTTSSSIFLYGHADINNSTTVVDSGGIFLWGAQLEAGAYSTTYIPTTNATATRVTDTFTRNNISTNGLITSEGGTWYMELRNNIVYTRDNSNVNINLDDSTGFNNGFVLRNSIGTSRLVIQKTISGASSNLFITTTDAVKIAIKWNGTTADVFQNGVKVVSATAFTTVALQNFITGMQVPVFIQAMALYPQPLSNIDSGVLTGANYYTSYAGMAQALNYTIS